MIFFLIKKCNVLVFFSDCEVMLVGPGPLSFYCPPGLEPLTEVCQVLVHQGNFRYPDSKNS